MYQTPLEVVQALSPFVKQGTAPMSAPELSVGTAEAKPAVKKAVRVDLPPPSEAETAKQQQPADVWGSLTEGTIPSVGSRKSAVIRKPPAVAVSERASRKQWLIGGGAAVGVLLLALMGMWASGVFKVKTKDGTIVLENLPADAEVLVDGETVTLQARDGKTITITAGKRHQLQVKKEGFKVFGKEVEIDAGERRPIRVTLQPESAAGKPPQRESKRASTTPPAPERVTEDKGAAKKENPFFNEEDLTGWDGLPDYWQVKNSCIVGEPPPGQKAHTFLCSKKTYRDFDLKFRVKREGGIGNSGVQFRSQINNLSQFTVVGPQCEIDDLNFTLAPGSLVTEPDGVPLKVTPSAAAMDALAKVYQNDAFNDFHIRCVGKHVTIKVNDVTTVDGDFPSLPDEGIIAWQLNGYRTPRSVMFRIVEFTDLSTPVSSSGFVPLFNGKDLTGWKTHPRQSGNWRVVRGTNGNVLTGSGPAISHLYSERGDYKDFHLRVETRINDGGNSGVYFRTSFGPQWPANSPSFPSGYEAQINSTHRDINKTGSLYGGTDGALVSIRETLVPPEQWFILEVIAQSNRILVKVDGKTTADFTDEKHRFTSGHIALQQHDPQTEVEFRKIEIKELK